MGVEHGELNLIWCAALVEGLVRNGVHYAVASPGSRSTPLTLACARHPGLHLRMLPDERSAAFFALGISKLKKSPVAMIATSGTAPANWYPAVIEASYDYHSLIMLSADRPAELQDCGANQTIDQTRLFGIHARAFQNFPPAEDSATALQMARNTAARAVDNSRWPIPGPVHINVPLREPLVPKDLTASLPGNTDKAIPRAHYPRLSPDRRDVNELSRRMCAGNGLIVCGRADYPDGFAAAVGKLADRLHSPILADPLSGLRFGRHDRHWIFTHYDALLRAEDMVQDYRPDWVLRFGGIPISKSLQRFLGGLPQDTILLVVPYGPWPDIEHSSTEVYRSDPLELCHALLETGLHPTHEPWQQTLLDREHHAAGVLQKMENKPLEAEILESTIRLSPEGTQLFCANSMVIRDIDSFAGGSQQHLQLHGNRGASGIDGNVSTALGMAAVAEGPVIALLGDLTLYHDMNGLLAAADLDIVMVVFNNGGGAIFGYLPQAALPEFEACWLTPPGLDIAQIAQLYGLNHHRVRDEKQFTKALKRAINTPGADMIEVIIDREDSLRRHKRYWKIVSRKI